MAILVSDNFNYKARKPLDNRIMQPDLAALKKLKDATLYDGMLCYVQSEDKFYVYDSGNSVDPILNKFRELSLDNGSALVNAYAQNVVYKKDSLVYYDDQVARVIADYTSDSTEATAENSWKKDIDDNKLVLLSGETTQNIKPYIRNTQYYRNDLVFIGTSLARVVADFVSDNTAATDEDAFKADIANNNLTLISGGTEEFLVYETTKKLDREINKTTILKFADIIMAPGSTISDLVLESLVYDSAGTVGKITNIDETADEITVTTMSISESNQYMKQAPDKRVYIIDNPGTGYAVGDVIESQEIGKFVEITQVGAGGEIEKVIESLVTVASTSGTGAVISTKKVLYVGTGNNWIILPDYIDTDTHSFEYKPGDKYVKGNLVVHDSKLYLVTKDFTANNFLTDTNNKDIIPVDTGMPIAPNDYTLTIEDPGYGYAVGDIVETTISGKYVEVTSIDINGEIIGVQDTTSTTASGAGIDAIIKAEHNQYVAEGDQWTKLTFPTYDGLEFKIYEEDTTYNEGDWVVLGSKSARVARVRQTHTVPITSSVSDEWYAAINSGKIELVNDNTLRQYLRGGNYQKHEIIIDHNDKLYFTTKAFEAADVNVPAGGTGYKIDYCLAEDIRLGNLVEIGGGSGDANLTKDIKATITVGNINANETVKKDTSFTDFVEKLLVKEITPTGNIVLNPTAGLKLKGTTVNVTSITANVTNVGTVTINNIKFYKGNTLLDTQTFVTGTNSYSYTFPAAESIITNQSYSIGIEYTKKDGSISEAKYTGTYEFVNDCYYGLTGAVPTVADITTMSKTPLKKIKGTTQTFSPNNEHIVYAYPSGLGDLTSIKDQNNFEYLTNSYTKTTATINGETYNIYYLTSPVTATNLKQVFA